MIAALGETSEEEKFCSASVIAENNNRLIDQDKCHFLSQNGRKTGKRICNQQLERTAGMPSLPGTAQVTTNLPVSKWSHGLQHLSRKVAKVSTMPGTTWQAS